MRLMLGALAVSGCTATVPTPNAIDIADVFTGLHESTNREVISSLVGVDPVRIEWCAAFVNAILYTQGVSGSESVSDAPLMARSFLRWGVGVDVANIQRGDVVIFPRGNAGWQGHVGFYHSSAIVDGVPHMLILGGNQSDSVSYEYFKTSSVIGIRRAEEANNATN